jgi:hypothetical protein
MKSGFELCNHLGNVIVTVSDRKLPKDTVGNNTVDHFRADVLSAWDYYAFGMQMPGRNYSATEYRFGFNGQEKDNQIYGSGNSYTAEFWQYDARLGRRWNVDPIFKEWESPFACLSGNPVFMVDILGSSAGDYLDQNGNYLGWDGKKDDNVYIVTDWTQARIIKKNDSKGLITPSLPNGTFFDLPSFEIRKKIQRVYEQGSTPTSTEHGGRIFKDFNGKSHMLRSEDGKPAGPYDTKAEINLDKFHHSIDLNNFPALAELEATWHDHPDMEWKSADNGKTWIESTLFDRQQTINAFNSSKYGSKVITKTFSSQPTGRDITNAKLRMCNKNYVLSRIDEVVYFYNMKTIINTDIDGTTYGNSGKVPLSIFFNYQAKNGKK